jgi:gluconolactonase
MHCCQPINIKIMKIDLITILFLGTLFVSCKPNSETSKMQQENTDAIGQVIVVDERFNTIVKPGAYIEKIAEGYQWTEGPLWIENGNYLLFSEIPTNTIYKWTEAKGAEVYISPSGYTGLEERGGEPGSNGLILDPQGRLVMCQHGDRQMARMNAPLDSPESSFVTIVSKWEGKRFNSPNDAIYDSKGNLYFTDPPYGLVGNVNDPAKEIDFQGVYRYGNDGVLTLLTDSMTRPNGLALSPDERTLYVANSDPDKAIWNAFDISENGEISNERVFFDVTGKPGKGLPDGMKIMPDGTIFATAAGGVWVFTPEGEVLGRIDSGEATSNCAFNSDYSILYMTCDDYVMRIKLN